MAVDASSVSVVLGAPGQAGSPQVVTAAGLVFTQAPAPAATSAYWNYDGTNLVGNVPASKGFSFTVGAVQKLGIGSTGLITTAISTGVALTAASAAFGFGFTGDQAAMKASWGDGVVVAATNTTLASNGQILLMAGTSTNAMNVQAVATNPTTYVGQVGVAHLAGGSVPLSLNTCRIGLGAGTTSSGTAVTASGHDLSGRVGVTVNSTGTVSQPVLLVSFATAYATPPFIQLSPGNAATATQSLATTPFPVTTTTGFSIQANTTGMPANTYLWYYNIFQ